MLTAADFLDPAGRERVAAAIARAEGATGAEIRVHLEDHIEEDILDHAVFIFEELNMHRTRWRNGVLICISVADRAVAIIGDSGINAVVPAGYWTDVLEYLQGAFRSGRRVDGITEAVRMVGERLAAHFPPGPEDMDELSNEVSLGGRPAGDVDRP